MDSIKRECYSLVQAVVCARDIFCRAPGCGNLATAGHHIFGRGNLATAFDPRYCIGMCVDCHVPWAHKEPDEFRYWVLGWMGAEEYSHGHQLSLTVAKYVDFKQVLDNLRQELAQYKSP